MGLDIYFRRVRRIDEKNSVHTEVAYFRKVNFLMTYFDYEGNCEEKEITLAEIKELVSRCRQLLATKKINPYAAGILAKELLPTQSGFFFGSTEYDEWYFNDVKEVERTFSKILREDKDDTYTMYCWW